MKKSSSPVVGVLLISLFLCFALTVRVVQSATDWWPMFHYDSGHAGYSTSTAPTTNSTLWNYTTGGSVSSSPTVFDNVVYIGSYDKKVYALNPDGSVKWSYATGEAV